MAKRKIKVIKLAKLGWCVIVPMYGFTLVPDAVSFITGFPTHAAAFTAAYRRAGTSSTTTTMQVNTSGRRRTLYSREEMDWY